MFITRLISGILLLAIVIGAIIAGEGIVFLLTAVLSIIGMYELYRTYHIHKNGLGIAGYVAAVIYMLLIWCDMPQTGILGICAAFLIFMSIYVLRFPKYNISEITFALFGILYVPVMMMHLYQIRRLGDGFFMIWLVFISAWGNDTCAYCVGMLIGKHKMAPRLSPKKSLEGAIGGITGAVILGAGYGHFMKEQLVSFTYPAFQCAIICGLCSLIAIVGDLSASAIKRNQNIKDFGTLIPGHGGVLDRFDSILLTAPAVYFLAIHLGSVS